MESNASVCWLLRTILLIWRNEQLTIKHILRTVGTVFDSVNGNENLKLSVAYDQITFFDWAPLQEPFITFTTFQFKSKQRSLFIHSDGKRCLLHDSRVNPEISFNKIDWRHFCVTNTTKTFLGIIKQFGSKQRWKQFNSCIERERVEKQLYKEVIILKLQLHINQYS